jgi:hypothetical protein
MEHTVNLLRKLFPVSCAVRKADTPALIRSIVIYTAAVIAYFLITAILGYILGRAAEWLLGLFGTLLGLYSTGGVLLSVLRYCGIME